jgi:hypothetical protein
MPNYPYTFQLPPLNVQDIPNDGVAGEFLGINGSGQLDWLTAGGGGSGDMLAANNLSELTNFATARTNIGLGTTNTPTFANLTLTSPSLSSSAPVTISQTWGTTGTYTAFKVVANETAAANSASNLLELWSGNAATLKFKVDKSGAFTFNGLTMYNGGGYIRTASAIQTDFRMYVGTSVYVGFIAGADTVLERDAANTLALRNGALAQTFNVYGTWTTAITNFERLAIKYNTTDLAYQIAAEKGSTNGDYRPLQLWTGGASRLHVSTAGNVGIGTTAPSTKLDVVGLFQVSDGTTGKRGLISSIDSVSAFISPSFWGAGGTYVPLHLQTSELTRLAITTAGNVGIGTTAPGAPLEVYKAAGVDANGGGILISRAIYPSLPNPGDYRACAIYLRYINAISEDCLIFGVADNAGKNPYTNFDQARMVLSSSGKVGIGTTSPTSKLHVAGTIKPEQATMVDKAAGFTLAAVDAGTVINSTSATGITINLPAADTAAGYNVMIIQSGAGAVTIAANTNTLNSFGSAFTTAGQHAACSIVRTAASTYNLSGNLV